jgi:hypothetical protein
MSKPLLLWHEQNVPVKSIVEGDCIAWTGSYGDPSPFSILPHWKNEDDTVPSYVLLKHNQPCPGGYLAIEDGQGNILFFDSVDQAKKHAEDLYSAE